MKRDNRKGTGSPLSLGLDSHGGQESAQHETAALSAQDAYYLVPPRQAETEQHRRRRRSEDAMRRQQFSSKVDYEGILPPLPGRRRRPNLAALISFLVFVGIPTFIAAFYYLAVASPQYVAEFKFSVKNNTPTANPAGSGMFSLFGGDTISTNNENYLVVEYLTSRQAVEDLQRRLDLVGLYSRPEIDSWSRYDASQPLEKFVGYWRNMVRAHFDMITGIATAEVRAFSPQDAVAVAQALVAMSEKLVNDISMRTRNDTVQFAEGEVEKAQERVRRILTVLIERNTGKLPVSSDANTPLLLDLERQAAQNMLTSAMQTLEQARANALTQQLYVTPFVRPSLPQSSTYPRPLVEISIVAAVAFAIWLAGLLVMRAILERFN